MYKWLLIGCAVVLVLACNFPGFPGAEPTPGDLEGEVNASPTASFSVDEPTPEAPTATATPPAEQELPTPTETPEETDMPTPSPTATQVPPGPPLGFRDPAWELVDWKEIPGTGEWEGTLRALVTGGRAPYRAQIDDHDIVAGLRIPVEWRLCQPWPATLRVWSADGQSAETGIWIWEVGCPPD